MIRKLSLLLALLMLLTLACACAGTPEDSGAGSPSANPPAGGTSDGGGGDGGGDIDTDEGWTGDYEDYIPPAADVSAELTIMMWAGDGSYMQDIGHKDYAPEDLTGQNQAAAYAVAKEFNKLYPNVKINIFAKQDDPDSDDMLWAQHIENFRAEYGKYPDFYAATDIPGDIKKGMCADISIFENDPVYRSFNKSVLELANYGGRQFALPQFMQPWGVYVNKTLAESNNIDIPGPNWTIDEYTSFVSHSSPADWWYGAMDCPLDFLRTGSKGFAYSLTTRGDGDPYVNLATEEFYKLMEYVSKWSGHAVWPQNDLGNTPEGFMDEYWWWSYRFFQQGRLLTLDGDPWMMGDQANPDPESFYYVSWDWDIYPRPSTAELGNTVGVVFDPFAIHNYYADPGVSEEDAYAKLQIAYEFAKFWCADTRAWKARAEQMWTDQGAIKTALNDSLPMVVGKAFDEQMEIFYSTATHQRFADKAKMPGFQKVLELWENGDIWDVSDKAYPWRYESEGSVREILFEYLNSWDPDVNGGARRTDANWIDNIKARMPDWNREFNERWVNEFKAIDDALNKYYK
ncbi:MAG: hypothetical protein LBH95_01645 [Oscillospiraceae bacterium]|jgi:hypothetical protein|nr:hypothetical protein [Oscillospiraceae bacterium]